MKLRNIVVLLVMASLTYAHMNIDGSHGLFRTKSAFTGSAGHFHIGFYTRYFGETMDAAIAGDSTGEANHAGRDLFFGLGYALSDNFSFNVASSYHGDCIDYVNSDYKRASMGLGDTKIGLKLGFGGEKMKVGINPFVSLPTGDDRTTDIEQKSYPLFGEAYGNNGGVFRYFSSGATDYGAVALITMKFQALILDFNFGYVDRNKNDDVLGWRNNYTIYRTALSLNLGSIVPFVELGGIDFCGKDQLLTFIDDDSVYGPNPVFITPGISIRPGNFNIDLAVDLRGWEGKNERAFPTATTDNSNTTTGWGVAPTWAAVLGLSYCANLKPEAPTRGDVAGSVVNSMSNDPIEANANIYKEDALVRSTVSKVDGTFELTDLDPGTYTLAVGATDYEEYKTDVIVKAGETTPVNIVLIPKEGELTLIIIDLETKEPMTVQLTIGNMEPETAAGKVTKILKTGDYVIKAIADDENYLPYERTVVVESGQRQEVEVALVKKEFKIELPEVYFETAKAEIKPESFDILDDAAKTITKVLTGSPDVVIEIQGHTDNRGTDEYNLNLSQERANSVKDYLVSKHNLDSARLNAKGYGESKPVATNNTEEGMAKNRRVEFVIVE